MSTPICAIELLVLPVSGADLYTIRSDEACNSFLMNISATCKWKAHIRSNITKLNVKVRSKLAAINILAEEEFNAEIEGRVYLPLTFQHFTDGVFPWEVSNQGICLNILRLCSVKDYDLFKGSFREDFKLIDCWMLLKRNEEQPGQSNTERRSEILEVFPTFERS